MKRIEIYTDGACRGNPGPGGWGALLKFDNHEKEISGGEDNTTNNRMELLAAIKAIESVKETCEIDLYTDSKYVNRALPSGSSNGKVMDSKTQKRNPWSMQIYGFNWMI